MMWFQHLYFQYQEDWQLQFAAGIKVTDTDLYFSVITDNYACICWAIL